MSRSYNNEGHSQVRVGFGYRYCGDRGFARGCGGHGGQVEKRPIGRTMQWHYS